MKNLHIKVTQRGTVEITDATGTRCFNADRVSVDFDNHSETSYEEHQFTEIVTVFRAMQEATAILNA